MSDNFDKWIKILISVVVAVIIWASIMMTVVTIHGIRMDERRVVTENAET